MEGVSLCDLDDLGWERSESIKITAQCSCDSSQCGAQGGGHGAGSTQ